MGFLCTQSGLLVLERTTLLQKYSVVLSRDHFETISFLLNLPAMRFQLGETDLIYDALTLNKTALIAKF